jgi:DNA-binding NarL/FixJ family response regulator
MLTTADDAHDIARCYALGCSGYIKKPVAYALFSDAIHALGRFTQLLLVPEFLADRAWDSTHRGGTRVVPGM